MIIDAHAHLWKKQRGTVNSKPVYGIGNGKSVFGDEIRQMLPPYMIDDKNTAEVFISNMDFASVSAAVITQEYIDGNQDEYLLEVKKKYPRKFKVCALYEERPLGDISCFDGVKICAGRLKDRNLSNHRDVFALACESGKFISIDLAEGVEQTDALKRLAAEYTGLKIVVGHFGMVTREGWLSQIMLAESEHVRIESGGITWLFNDEFYPYPSAVAAIAQAAEAVGMDKLMWGSDYPRTMTAVTYKMSLDFIEKTDVFSQIDKHKLLGENAKSFYGFDDMETPEPIKHMAQD